MDNPPNDSSGGGRWLPVALRLVQLGPALTLLLIVIALSSTSDVFLTERNLKNLGFQTAIVALLAIGQLMVILARCIDLSVGSTIAFAAVVGGLILEQTGNIGLAFVAIPVAGALVGLANGLILVKGKFPHPFIVTLAMLFIVRGAALQLVDGGRIVFPISGPIATLGTGYLGPIPIPAVVVVAVGACFYVLLAKLKWGRWIYATGGSPDAAERNGIAVNRVVIGVYVMSGLCAGIAALITVGRVGGAYPGTTGQLAELDAIAAVIIGGASFLGGRGAVSNAIVGALLLGVIRNGLNLLNVGVFWQQIAVGAIVLIGVRLDVFRGSVELRLRTEYARRAETTLVSGVHPS